VKTVCGSDEPHPYPVRSFTYRTEQVRANEVQTEIVYKLNRSINSEWANFWVVPLLHSSSDIYTFSTLLYKHSGSSSVCGGTKFNPPLENRLT